MNNIKMLYFDRIDVSAVTDVKSASKKCDICHYWYFLCYSFNQMSAIDIMTH